MITDKRLGRQLGVAFLVVWLGSAASAALSVSILSDDPAETLENVAANTAQFQWSTMIDLCITSVGIVVLAVLLYTAVRRQNPTLALIGLGWWLTEAATLAVSTIGAFLLIPLSTTYAEAGASGSPDLLVFAETLQDFDRQMWEIHMIFYGVGALAFYYLLYEARAVPRWLSLFGLAAVVVGLFSSVIFLGADIEWFFLGFPIGVFELVIGGWLIVRGVNRADTETLGTVSDSSV
jgi:hypothetical protein